MRRSLHVDATTSQNEGRDTGEQLVMHTINLRYYRRRLRRSERLRYRLARFVLWVVPLSVFVVILAYTIAAHG